MKCVILAGGLGSRLSEETAVKPKPMVEIGGRPILWHIMKIYSAHGFNDFIICLGYKGYVIKEYFANYFLHMSDVTIRLKENKMEIHRKMAEPWNVTLVDTGDGTQTGGRIKRILPFVEHEPYFALTYGDGLADINIAREVAFHQEHGGKATVAVVRPTARFGSVVLAGNRVTRFMEKPEGDGGWINGGFFVLAPGVGDLIEGDDTVWEKEPMETMASSGELHAFVHEGFWHPMDTLRDRNALESEWAGGGARWKVW
jgi:glucose-1-phosphate cytidylyltransferase